MAGFPDIVRNLPEAATPFRDISVWLLQGPTASAIFVQAEADSEVPEHRHGAQWGVVVAGELVLTIGGTTRTYRPGEEYLIPAGVPHSARLRSGVRVIDFFDDPNRYRPKEPEGQATSGGSRGRSQA
jgi:hypothetical protein